MNSVTPFPLQYIRAICEVIADTNRGLTGAQIGEYLSLVGIPDPEPGITKWRRLYSALTSHQEEQQNADGIIAFIETAMSPVLYSKNPENYSERRHELNRVLAFCGFHLTEEGKMVADRPVNTLSEAAQREREARNRERRLIGRLTARGVHEDVLNFCRAELLEDNYFHAVLEATKSVADKIRRMSGLAFDGSQLVRAAFSGDNPLLALNDLTTPTHRSEQAGFMNLLMGMFSMFRNPVAHEPRITWPIDEQDALDLMSLVSYFHRRLDSCSQNTKPS